MLIDVEDVCRAVGLVLGHRGTKAEDRLEEDLGAESIDVLNIVLALEQQFGVSIPEAALAGVVTVRDLYDVVLKNGHAEPTDPARTA